MLPDILMAVLALNWLVMGIYWTGLIVKGFRRRQKPSAVQSGSPITNPAVERERIILAPASIVCGPEVKHADACGYLGTPESPDLDTSYVHWISSYLSLTQPGHVLSGCMEVRLCGGPYDGATVSLHPDMGHINFSGWPTHRKASRWAIYERSETVYMDCENNAVSDHTVFRFTREVSLNDLRERFIVD